jgi:hypothetical protein
MPDSQRNALIADFNAGVVHPDYEVIPNKNTKGKYTVRKRKVSLPVKKNETPKEGEETPKEEAPPKKEENFEEEFEATDKNYNPYTDDENYMPKGMKEGRMFREMQLQLNKAILENMKVYRHQIKYQQEKYKKYKEKTKKVYDIITQVANQPKKKKQQQVEYEEEEDYEEELVEPPPKKQPKGQRPQQEPIIEYESEYEEQEPQKEYANEYEAQLADMNGENDEVYSRRNRLKSFI